jgi:hypothetical protein
MRTGPSGSYYVRLYMHMQKCEEIREILLTVWSLLSILCVTQKLRLVSQASEISPWSHR